MLSRLPAAIARALVVALLIVFPSVALPATSADTGMMALFLAACVGILIMTEYLARAPSLIEFRDAPPFNRIRFLTLSAMVIFVTLLVGSVREPGASPQAIGALMAAATDLPFSPVRLMRQMMPSNAPDLLVLSVTRAAAVCYVIGLVGIASVFMTIHLRGWPSANSRFNIWVNLPTFDPVGHGDAVARLLRVGQINLILGFLLPFMFPAFVTFTSGIVDPMRLAAPQTLIWTVTGWAFVPASLIMRGIALMHVGRLVEEQRRQAALSASSFSAV